MAGLLAMSLLENAVFWKGGVVRGSRFQKLKFRDEDDLPLPGSIACPVAESSLLSSSLPWWSPFLFTTSCYYRVVELHVPRVTVRVSTTGLPKNFLGRGGSGVHYRRHALRLNPRSAMWTVVMATLQVIELLSPASQFPGLNSQ